MKQSNALIWHIICQIKILNINAINIRQLSEYFCKHNFYKFKEVDPTEEKEGKIYYKCGFCGKQIIKNLPRLNNQFYLIEELKANCEHGNGKRYISKENGNKKYEITDDIRHEHTIYGYKCNICNKSIGEFDFHKLGDLYCYGYPRLYALSEYWNNTWLLGGDNGTILCHRSQDKGLTWSTPSIVSTFPNHFCSNVDFFELPNHDIICSYRAIGNPSNDNPQIKYNRKIFSSISKDGGKTWEDLGLIIDNFVLAKRLGKSMNDAIKAVIYESNVGFFEPFVQYFNNTITVIYADDFTPMLLLLSGSIKDSRKEQSIYSHTYDLIRKKWSSKRKLLMNGYIKKSPTKSGLNKKISRDGMPVTDVMKDGTYVMVFEGTYRRKSYNYFTGGLLDEYHPFEIVISYSKDGENWSNPVEIYRANNNGSKYSAPYICITEKDQLIISFQTDENSVNSGYIGDLYSIMKVLISKPGIPLEKINADSFYAITNNNRSPIGGASLWSGMMLINNILYTCSSGHPILYSELPIYDEPNKYNKILKNKYIIKNGQAEFFGNKIIIKEDNSFIINKDIIFNTSINIFTDVKPNNECECGIILNYDDYYNLNDYYIFELDNKGRILIKKIYKRKTMILFSDNSTINDNFNKENVYRISIKYNYNSNQIFFLIEEKEIYQLYDESINKLKIGIFSSKKDTIFTQLLLK